MATTFLNLPTPAANGAGAAVDVSGLGAAKTIVNGGNGYIFEPFVSIEISCDAGGANWQAIHTFQAQQNEVTIAVPCHFMRAVVSNYRGGGAPAVDVGAEDDPGVTFATLVAPPGDGAGAAVAASSLPNLKTFEVTGTFRGTVNIQITEDAGASWQTIASFSAPGVQRLAFTAQQMRVFRTGVPTVEPGLPLVDIAASAFGGGGGGLGITAISAGTTNATGPGVSFGNGSGVSFGVNGNTITASVDAGTPFGVSAGTQSVSTGTVVFSNSNNVTFGMSGSSRVTASASFPAETPFGLSAGTQSVSTGTVVFSNSNGVTFGMSGSRTITASYSQSTAPAAISASGSSAGSGTVVFSNSNNVSFGMNGNTITATATSPAETPFGISAGTQSVSTGTLVFSNSNNVTFGMSGSSRVTASASFPAETPFAVSAGTQSVSTGTISFANSNGVTFGMSGSNTITASVAGAAETPFGISAGTQSVSTGTVSFANSNGITFGMSGSNTITASVDAGFTYNQFVPMLDASKAFANFEQSSLMIQPRTVPALSWSHVGMLHQFTGSTNSTGTVNLTRHVGIYTRNVSTLSLLMSTSFSISINHSGDVNSQTNNGIRLVTTGWTSSLNRSDYWFGILEMSGSSSQNATIQRCIANATQASAFSGYAGVAFAGNATAQEVLGLGVFSAATAAMPNSVAFTEIRGTDQAYLRPVWFELMVWT